MVQYIFLQIQLEKEKLGYELENVQSQLDKVIAQSARLQKEKETAQVDADRLRDKYEKVQVIISILMNITVLTAEHFSKCVISLKRYNNFKNEKISVR